MSTERQQNAAASLSRVVAIFACFSFLACFSLAGCSNATVEEPVKKKKVVQDMNISPNANSESSENKAPPVVEKQSSPEDEIESLPFEPQKQQEEEKELPVLED